MVSLTGKQLKSTVTQTEAAFELDNGVKLLVCFNDGGIHLHFSRIAGLSIQEAPDVQIANYVNVEYKL